MRQEPPPSRQKMPQNLIWNREDRLSVAIELESEMALFRPACVCAALLFGVATAPMTAQAAPYQIVWTLNNVDFGSSDPITGSFTYSSINGITQLSITSGLFGSFTQADVHGQDLNLSTGTNPFIHSLLLQHDFALSTTEPTQLAKNPLFGGSDDFFLEELTLNLKDGPFLSGVLTTIQTTPLPGTLALFASGIGGLGLLGRRKKRKPAIAA
jgi:hypothetical protein